MKKILFQLLLVCLYVQVFAQNVSKPFLFLYGKESVSENGIEVAHPLDTLALANVAGMRIKVFDGNGTVYFSGSNDAVTTFIVGGALGNQEIKIYNAQNKITDSISFIVDAQTNIDDGGYYGNMFKLFYNGMFSDVKTGTFPVQWNGKMYHVFVPWVLDNYQTMKGLKYFLPDGRELIDIMRQSQREDGMIYSFIQYTENADYFLTRDKYSGYSKKIGDKVFVRQPVENHPEYLYVNTIYDCWKSEGDNAWMQQNLASAEKALDYALHDPARWSNRFKLLKRAYTIDSWDFAVEDEYMPDIGITNTMIIDPLKTKFGIFFGDNTGYVTACYQLAEMLEASGNTTDAAKYKQRADEMKQRLDALAWNGNFFTHFIDEDSNVHRHLGVDEKRQLAQSNAYSLNRNISHEQSKAIIESYLDLKEHLPVGSPGEWYAIYPPFQKGFGKHDAIWQYMNGGVGGHVAGELSRGAYENGYENYATDILNRIFELGKKYDNKIWFAYTGSIPAPPPAPSYKPLDLSSYANMNSHVKKDGHSISWMNSFKNGDDFSNLPTGEQTFAGIKFNVIDPQKNNDAAVIAVSKQKGFPASVQININDTASCIYFLHTASKPVSENVAADIKIMYDDSSYSLQYIIMGKQLTYWWFSELKTDYSGIAWYGKNSVSEGIGLSWCAINNPQPQKRISKIILESVEGDVIYTVFAITLSNHEHYVPVSPVSYGGPDDWASATNMDAMIEGLAGIKDAAHTLAFSTPVISPRWTTTSADTVFTTVRYAASKGYASYKYIHDPKQKTIFITATSGAEKMYFHVLLPEKTSVQFVKMNNQNISFKQSFIEQSHYADFEIDGKQIKTLQIKYQ